jgi:hypothetical protein
MFIFISNFALFNHSSAVRELSPYSGYLYLCLGLTIFTMTFEEDGTCGVLLVPGSCWLTLFVKFCFHCAWVMPAYVLSSFKEYTVPFVCFGTQILSSRDSFHIYLFTLHQRAYAPRITGPLGPTN